MGVERFRPRGGTRQDRKIDATFYGYEAVSGIQYPASCERCLVAAAQSTEALVRGSGTTINLGLASS